MVLERRGVLPLYLLLPNRGLRLYFRSSSLLTKRFFGLYLNKERIEWWEMGQKIRSSESYRRERDTQKTSFLLFSFITKSDPILATCACLRRVFWTPFGALTQ